MILPRNRYPITELGRGGLDNGGMFGRDLQHDAYRVGFGFHAEGRWLEAILCGCKRNGVKHLPGKKCDVDVVAGTEQYPQNEQRYLYQFIPRYNQSEWCECDCTTQTICTVSLENESNQGCGLVRLVPE